MRTTSCSSVGGLVTKWFGRIPSENESFERDQVRMTVLKTSNNRIEQVQIEDLNRDELYNGLEAFREEKENERAREG